ncbi:hypothetical protein DPMN_171440 [Dreissena polymorpha]|uniref:Uncharacterized protein n=1 Tax=Dreissena polymorpha TaxID=45954 RepID=A0A9D4DY04_DREPO|nr:hypothetical protein DPMN_171440 [Dreissena polymorpha]
MSVLVLARWHGVLRRTWNSSFWLENLRYGVPRIYLAGCGGLSDCACMLCCTWPVAVALAIADV